MWQEKQNPKVEKLVDRMDNTIKSIHDSNPTIKDFTNKTSVTPESASPLCLRYR